MGRGVTAAGVVRVGTAGKGVNIMSLSRLRIGMKISFSSVACFDSLGSFC